MLCRCCVDILCCVVFVDVGVGVGVGVGVVVLCLVVLLDHSTIPFRLYSQFLRRASESKKYKESSKTLC